MSDVLSADAPVQAPAQTTGKPKLESAAHHVETVLWVKHWTERLFSFGLTRPASFRFRSGEFVMIGLPGSPTRRESRRSP